MNIKTIIRSLAMSFCILNIAVFMSAFLTFRGNGFSYFESMAMALFFSFVVQTFVLGLIGVFL